MNKVLRNDAKSYLSWKRIVLMSLALSVGFHFVFMLAYFFGETFVNGPEKSPEKRHESRMVEPQVGADTLYFDQSQPQIDKPQGHKEIQHKKFKFSRILMHTSFSFLMICGLFFFNRRVLRMTFKKPWEGLFFGILGSLLLATLMSIGFSLLPSLFDAPKPGPHFLMRMVRDGLTRDLSMTSLVIMICYLLRALYRQKVIAVENEELRTENIRTHYEALKSQLDPHFLFNSLNTLQSLIEIDGEKAGDYVQQLSSVLRYTLQNKEVVMLADEMNCVQAYCSMMQIRYGDNLRVDFQVDSRYNEYMVLPLAVQGLVENAIKHNVISAKQPLEIRMMTTDGGLLEISNAIQPKIKDEADGGLGLANLVERYRLQWNKEVGIMDDGRRFKVTIPLMDRDK